jgi:hypothetical protein
MFDFPASPSLGQTYSPVSGLTYTWDGAKWVTSGWALPYMPSMPGGRLTPTTGTPIPSAAVSAGANVYYSPHNGPHIPIFDGSVMVPTLFNELTNVLSNATDNPAAAVASKIYDLFVWLKAGVPTLSRGPAWTSDTVRSLGISRTSGLWTNTSGITNGPAANRGTYVGSIRTNAAATLDWGLGGSGPGGVNALLMVWNAYNRVPTVGASYDTTTSWNVPSGDRAMNGSGQNRVYVLKGLNEDPISFGLGSRCFCASTGIAHIFIGKNGTTGATALPGRGVVTGSASPAVNMDVNVNMTAYDNSPGLGWNWYQACENANAASVMSLYGSGYMVFYANTMQ